MSSIKQTNTGVRRSCRITGGRGFLARGKATSRHSPPAPPNRPPGVRRRNWWHQNDLRSQPPAMNVQRIRCWRGERSTKVQVGRGKRREVGSTITRGRMELEKARWVNDHGVWEDRMNRTTTEAVSRCKASSRHRCLRLQRHILPRHR